MPIREDSKLELIGVSKAWNKAQDKIDKTRSQRSTTTKTTDPVDLSINKSITLREKLRWFLAGTPGTVLDIALGIKFVTPSMTPMMVFFFTVPICINAVTSVVHFNSYNVCPVLIMGCFLGVAHSTCINLFADRLSKVARFSNAVITVLLGILMYGLVYAFNWTVPVIKAPVEFVLAIYIGYCVKVYTHVDVEGVEALLAST